jgi:hypothetical protein
MAGKHLGKRCIAVSRDASLAVAADDVLRSAIMCNTESRGDHVRIEVIEWDEDNLGHATRHGVSVGEIE